MSTPKEIVEFMNIVEGLKRELRHSWLSDGRQESVAEHTWSMSLLAMLLFNEVEIKVDQLKVLKMVIIHDLAEVYAGDMPSFEAAAGKQKLKEENEQKAMKKLLKKISNKNLREEIESLWHEVEAKETNESKFVHACDKAEAVIQHNNSIKGSFSQGDFDLHPYYKDYLFNFDEYIREFKNHLDIDSMLKVEDENGLDKIKEEHRDRWIKQKATL